MEKVEVSVIMSEYNTAEEILKRSIKSILNQTFKDFELVLIDDGSLTDVNKIVNEFNDSRIKLIKNEKNLGLVKSLNKAIENSEGKYLIRMDTDDECLPNRFETLINFIKNNPTYSVVGSKAYEVNNNKTLGIIGRSGEVTKKDLMRGKNPIHPSVIMNKEDIINVGLYKEYKRCEDFVLWAELLLNNKKIYVIDDVLLKYYVNDSDYAKRKLKTRKDEIKIKKIYYKKMNANIIDRLFILRSILAGLCPSFIVKFIRKRIEMKKA